MFLRYIILNRPSGRHHRHLAAVSYLLPFSISSLQNKCLISCFRHIKIIFCPDISAQKILIEQPVKNILLLPSGVFCRLLSILLFFSGMCRDGNRTVILLRTVFCFPFLLCLVLLDNFFRIQVILLPTVIVVSPCILCLAFCTVFASLFIVSGLCLIYGLLIIFSGFCLIPGITCSLIIFSGLRFITGSFPGFLSGTAGVFLVRRNSIVIFICFRILLIFYGLFCSCSLRDRSSGCFCILLLSSRIIPTGSLDIPIPAGCPNILISGCCPVTLLYKCILCIFRCSHFILRINKDCRYPRCPCIQRHRNLLKDQTSCQQHQQQLSQMILHNFSFLFWKYLEQFPFLWYHLRAKKSIFKIKNIL